MKQYHHPNYLGIEIFACFYMELSDNVIEELRQLKDFYFVKDLKISNIILSDKGFLKLLCVQSKPIKEDSNIIKKATEWTFINQLVQIKVFDKFIIQKILDKKKLQDLTKSLMYFDWVFLEEIGRVGRYIGVSKNNYPIFWARDYYYKITLNNFALSLR